MPLRAKKLADSDVNLEIQRFSNHALALAKTVVDGSSAESDRATAREMADRLPELAAKAQSLSDAYRAAAMKALGDARLDLAFVAAGGGIPSSIRLGWYIKEQSESPGA